MATLGTESVAHSGWSSHSALPDPVFAPSRAFPQDLSCRAAPPSTELWGSIDGMPVSPLPLPVSLRSRSEEMRVITFALLRINPGEREENYYAQ